MKIWVNAFIPRDVAGYTVQVTQGTNVGKTAVPLPLIARLNPINLLKPLSAGYLTDQRSFDANPDVSVRMQSMAECSLGPAGWSLNSAIGSHRTSGTTEVDIQTGANLDFARADLSRSAFAGLAGISNIAGLPFTQFLHLKGAASDPLVSTSADIDFTGVFQITTFPPVAAAIHINWALTLDAFPAFEAYVEHNGVVKTILAVPPDSGKTVQDLVGQANRPFQGFVMFP